MNGATIIGILRGTPPWVFLLAALLVWLGLRSLRPHVTSVTRILTTPAVFITWGLVSFAAGGGSSGRTFVWILAAVAGLTFAVFTVHMRGLRVDRVHRLVLVPASVVPLVRNLLVFSAKYALAVAVVFHPQARDTLAVWDAAVSGVSAGYFFGWALSFARAYRSAASSDLSTSGTSRALGAEALKAAE